jgi:hypothetical protein
MVPLECNYAHFFDHLLVHFFSHPYWHVLDITSSSFGILSIFLKNEKHNKKN